MANTFDAQFPGQQLMFSPSGEPPDVPPSEIGGMAVAWREEWEEVPLTTHINWTCENCGNTRSHADISERPYLTTGVVAADGQPSRSLIAYWCGRCGRTVAYTMTPFTQVWVGLLT